MVAEVGFEGSAGRSVSHKLIMPFTSLNINDALSLAVTSDTTDLVLQDLYSAAL